MAIVQGSSTYTGHPSVERDGALSTSAEGPHPDDWEDRTAFMIRASTSAATLPAASETVNPDSFQGFPSRTIHLKPVAYARAKRVMDIVVAGFGLLVAAPLMAAIALLIKLTSRGPVIFKQVRVREGGRLFTCYKFRSMCADAEERRRDLLHLNEVTGPVFKIKRDPRVTPIGRILRTLSLDELPQLWNVLRGDMSIVGPRPPVPYEVERYTERQLARLAVRPGLTCLWQVSGRSAVAFDHWVELDLLYIETMSFWTDLIIIARTVPAVVFARGAH